MTTGLVFYPRILTGFRETRWSGVFISRVFRIIPLVSLSILLISAIIATRTAPRIDRSYAVAFAKWATAWAEVPIFGYPDSGRLNAYVLWSLWYEWLFYIVLLPACALAVDIIRRRGLPTWLVPALLLTAIVAANILKQIAHHPISALVYLPLFPVGMLAYECRQHPSIRRRLERPMTGIAGAAALIAGMVFFPVSYFAALPLFAFFFCCVACGNDLGGLLATRGARVLGECSFGIYLLHGILVDMLFTSFADVIGAMRAAALPVLLIPLAIIVTLLTATTFLLIEQPFIALGKAFARRVAGVRLRFRPAELEVAP